MRLAEVLAEQLTKVGGKAVLVEDMDEARAALRRILPSPMAGPVVRWATPHAEALLRETVPIDGSEPEDRRRNLCLAATAGITEVDSALADSGTLVLESGKGRSRMVSLLPPIHVALVPESRILESLPVLVQRLSGPDGTERLRSLSCLTFITGPSRTADIELTLTVGVHGPQMVYALIVRDL